MLLSVATSLPELFHHWTNRHCTNNWFYWQPMQCNVTRVRSCHVILSSDVTDSCCLEPLVSYRETLRNAVKTRLSEETTEQSMSDKQTGRQWGEKGDSERVWSNCIRPRLSWRWQRTQRDQQPARAIIWHLMFNKKTLSKCCETLQDSRHSATASCHLGRKCYGGMGGRGRKVEKDVIPEQLYNKWQLCNQSEVHRYNKANKIF